MCTITGPRARLVCSQVNEDGELFEVGGRKMRVVVEGDLSPEEYVEFATSLGRHNVVVALDRASPHAIISVGVIDRVQAERVIRALKILDRHDPQRVITFTSHTSFGMTTEEYIAWLAEQGMPYASVQPRPEPGESVQLRFDKGGGVSVETDEEGGLRLRPTE